MKRLTFDVSACYCCPFFVNHHGYCVKTGNIVANAETHIPGWCPLPDAPLYVTRIKPESERNEPCQSRPKARPTA